MFIVIKFNYSYYLKNIEKYLLEIFENFYKLFFKKYLLNNNIRTMHISKIIVNKKQRNNLK